MSLEWPQFIRRAQFVQLSVIELQNQYMRFASRTVPRTGTVHYIMHSLCSFLRDNHRLRSLLIDFGGLKTVFEPRGALQHLLDDVETALYPMRLLSNIKSLRVEGVSKDLATILTPSDEMMTTAVKINTGTPSYLLEHVRLVQSAYLALDQMPPFNLPVDELAAIKARAMSLVSAGDPLKTSGPLFLEAVDVLRRAWDLQSVEPQTEQCKKQVRDLVRLGVEVELAMSRDD